MNKRSKTLSRIAISILVCGIIASVVVACCYFIFQMFSTGFYVLFAGIGVSALVFFLINCIADLERQVYCLKKEISNIKDNMVYKKKKPEEVPKEPNEEDNYTPTVVKAPPKDIYEYAQREIKHLNKFEQVYLKEHNEAWYEEIKKLNEEELKEKIENSEEQRYVYLCCIELLERKGMLKDLK